MVSTTNNSSATCPTSASSVRKNCDRFRRMPIQLAVSLILFSFYFQNPNNTPEARAKIDGQNAELKSLLQSTPKLALDRSPLHLQGYGDDVVAGTVSWVSSDKNGLIYLIQRGDKIDPVVVMDKSGKVLRTWGKGMY